MTMPWVPRVWIGVKVRNVIVSSNNMTMRVIIVFLAIIFKRIKPFFIPDINRKFIPQKRASHLE